MWQLHFVAMKKESSAVEWVPILPAEYLARPTAWPQGSTGDKIYGFSKKIFYFNWLKPVKIRKGKILHAMFLQFPRTFLIVS